MEIFAT